MLAQQVDSPVLRSAVGQFHGDHPATEVQNVEHAHSLVAGTGRCKLEGHAEPETLLRKLKESLKPQLLTTGRILC